MPLARALAYLHVSRIRPRRTALPVALLAWLAAAAPAIAASGSLSYVRDGNVWVSPPDGATASAVTKDGTPSDPYIGASQSSGGVIVTLRHGTAYRLAQSGQPLGAPVSLGSEQASGGAVSADGATLAYEDVEVCGITPRACISTFFRGLASGALLSGYGLQMSSPSWIGSSAVVGSVAGDVDLVGPDQPAEQEWFRGDLVPAVGFGTQVADGVAASPDGTRIAMVSTAGSDGRRVLWLLTAPGAGLKPVTGQCFEEIPAGGPPPHPTWAPDGSAIAWAESDGVWTQSVVDLSGSDAGCQANTDTARLVIAGGVAPSWSARGYDPSPIALPAPGPAPTPAPKPLPSPPPSGGTSPASTAVSLRVGPATRLRRALRKGIVLTVSCARRCAVRGQARIDRRQARRYGLGRRGLVVARGAVGSVAGGGTARMSLRFSHRARRRLAGARRLTLKITVRFRLDSGTVARHKTLVLRS